MFSPEGNVSSAQAEAAFPSPQVFLLQQMKRPFYLVFFSIKGGLRAGPSNGPITLGDNPDRWRPKLPARNGEISQRAGWLLNETEGCFCRSVPPRRAEVSTAFGRNQRRIDDRSQHSFHLKAAACSLDPAEGSAASLGAERRFNARTPQAGRAPLPLPRPARPPALSDKPLEDLPRSKHLSKPRREGVRVAARMDGERT